MSSIEKLISPFIQQQFPSFYRAEGPNFIAFVRAYYEWLEQNDQTIGYSRSLLEYRDIDTTADQFIKYFKSEFMSGIPESILADKRLLLKHITDLYRAKGSKRAYELLFRMVYAEDVELFYPGEYIFKASDNTWYVPRYLEVTSGLNLDKLINTKIQTVNETASALVDNISSIVVNGRTITLLQISQILGTFNPGDTIYQSNLTSVTPSTGIRVVGSLDSIIVSFGGSGYQVGDLLDVVGSGINGQARVSSISNAFLGSVSFSIVDGGSGYTTNAQVSILPTVNFDIVSAQGFFTEGDLVQNQSNTASGTIHFANNTLVQLINFTDPDLFLTNDTLIGASGNAIIQRVFGGTGANANFKVGSITNKELITFNTTTVEDYLNLELDNSSNGFQIEISSVSGTFGANDTVTSSANVLYLEGSIATSTNISNGEILSNTALAINNLYVYRSDESILYCTGSELDLLNANVVSGVTLSSDVSNSVFVLTVDPIKDTVTGEGLVSSVNSTSLVLSSVNGYFVETATITSSNSGAFATIDDVIRLTDWEFDRSTAPLDNLDTIIIQSLPLESMEIGTIETITSVNPGINYFTRPVVRVTEPVVTNLLLIDDNGNLKGNNAIIITDLIGGNGTVITVDVINSGYSYQGDQSVSLFSANNPTQPTGTTFLSGVGKGEGGWLNRKSFVSDVMNIHDGFFYQDYSYQIIARRMLSSYEKLVRDLVHPAGLALFGAYRLDVVLQDDPDFIEDSTISQAV